MARRGIPVLAVWGAEDRVTGKAAIARLAEMNPDARHVEIAGAGHGLIHGAPGAVARAVAEFLAGPAPVEDTGGRAED